MLTGVLTTKCFNNKKQKVGIIRRYHKNRNCVCIRHFALLLLWKLFVQRISDAIFYDNILFYVFQKHFDQWPHSEWPRTSNNCWKVLRKRSNLVWKSKPLRYSTLKQIDSLQWWNQLERGDTTLFTTLNLY